MAALRSHHQRWLAYLSSLDLYYYAPLSIFTMLCMNDHFARISIGRAFFGGEGGG